EFEADGAGDTLLRNVEEAVEGLALRGEPDAVVDEFGIADRERLLQVRGFPVDGEAFEFAMRGDEERAAGSFVRAAGLHTHEAVLDKVGAADAVTRGDFVEGVEKIDGTEFAAVYRNRSAGFETDFDFFGFVGSFFGRDGPLPHGFARSVGGIFESPPSWLRCQMLRSRLLMVFLLCSIGTLCFSAYAMASSRESMSHSRHGAMI